MPATLAADGAGVEVLKSHGVTLDFRTMAAAQVVVMVR